MREIKVGDKVTRVVIPLWEHKVSVATQGMHEYGDTWEVVRIAGDKVNVKPIESSITEHLKDSHPTYTNYSFIWEFAHYDDDISVRARKYKAGELLPHYYRTINPYIKRHG